jgi:hypothetical protein
MRHLHEEDAIVIQCIDDCFNARCKVCVLGPEMRVGAGLQRGAEFLLRFN